VNTYPQLRIVARDAINVALDESVAYGYFLLLETLSFDEYSWLAVGNFGAEFAGAFYNYTGVVVWSPNHSCKGATGIVPQQPQIAWRREMLSKKHAQHACYYVGVERDTRYVVAQIIRVEDKIRHGLLLFQQQIQNDNDYDYGKCAHGCPEPAYSIDH
jgi:hypothetical protein